MPSTASTGKPHCTTLYPIFTYSENIAHQVPVQIFTVSQAEKKPGEMEEITQSSEGITQGDSIATHWNGLS